MPSREVFEFTATGTRDIYMGGLCSCRCSRQQLPYRCTIALFTPTPRARCYFYRLTRRAHWVVAYNDYCLRNNYAGGRLAIIIAFAYASANHRCC